MAAGLKAGHGQEFYVSHLHWSFASIGLVALTQALCLMFIFKMHTIMHDLVRRLDEISPPNPPLKIRGGQEGEI